MDEQMRRMLRDPFVWGFLLLGAVTSLLLLDFFLTGWTFPFWTRLAEWRHGPLDFPDSLGMAFDYCGKAAGVVGGVAVASGIAGFVRTFRRRQEGGG